MMELVWAAILGGGTLALAMSVTSFLIWCERRGLALFQDRLGPNRVGPLGLGIVLVDTIKILTKEDWTPPFADRAVFVIAPMIIMIAGFMSFAVIPYSEGVAVVDLDVGILFFLAMSSLGAYAVILGGWSSNNKYSLLGGLRAASQMMSYEVFMGLALLGPVLMAGSFNLGDIVEAQRGGWFVVPQFASFVLFWIAGLAETHRAPFDLPEADSEIVAGFRSEYSGMKFGMFMLGEYTGITVISGMITTVYLGGWLGPVLPGFVWFWIKSFACVAVFILARASLPRPRHDQLLSYGWKVLFPIALLNLIITGAMVLAWDAP